MTSSLSSLEKTSPPTVAVSSPVHPAMTDALYDQLRRIAGCLLKKERPHHTLQATEIAHEAWLRLAQSHAMAGLSRAHFLAICGVQVRRILIDHGRRKAMARRHGNVGRADPGDLNPAPQPSKTLEAVDDALAELGRRSPELARVVEMRFFIGMSLRQIAEVEGIHERTSKRRWAAARVFLARELGPALGHKLSR